MADKKKNILFVICAYVIFWILCISVLSGLFPKEGSFMAILTILGSWSPTIALLILFNKLFPGILIKEFYKNAFKERLNFKLILLVTIVQVLIFIGATCIIALWKEAALINMLDLSLQTIIAGIVISLITGATGEESGWRGFLQQSVEKKYGVIKSSLIVGIIWVAWHIPAWFIDGYETRYLIQYIIAFSISIISLAVIIGICYSRCRNLFVPIWLHFMYNFVVSVFVGDVKDMANVSVWIAIFYVIAAIGYVVWHKKD